MKTVLRPVSTEDYDMRYATLTAVLNNKITGEKVEFDDEVQTLFRHIVLFLRWYQHLAQRQRLDDWMNDISLNNFLAIITELTHYEEGFPSSDIFADFDHETITYRTTSGRDITLYPDRIEIDFGIGGSAYLYSQLKSIFSLYSVSEETKFL